MKVRRAFNQAKAFVSGASRPVGRGFLRRMNKHLDKIIFGILLLLFIGEASFFALNMRWGIYPDEVQWISIIKKFSESLGLPHNSPDTYWLGEITTIPYLYFWLMARILNINVLHLSEMYLLRMFNVLFASLTVVFSYFLVREITKEKLVHILTIVLLTNTLMFTFLAGGVNWDNLANLLAVLSVYLLIKAIKEHELSWSILLLLTILMGSLTKITFLPLALMVGIIWVFSEHRRIFPYLQKTKEQIPKKPIMASFVILILIFFLFLNFNLHGKNLIKYHTLRPRCDQVMSVEQCEYQALYRRDKARSEVPKKELRINFLYYAYKWGPELMMPRIFGIMGHETIYKTIRELVPYNIIMLLAFVLLIRNFDLKKRFILYLLAISCFYTGVLLYYQNYRAYLKTDSIDWALQGRYIFPVITPIYILMSNFLLKSKSTLIRLCIFIPVSIVFIVGNFPYFLKNVQPTWFNRYVVYDTKVGLNNNDHITGGIKTRDYFFQTFESEQEGLTGVRLYVSVYGNENLSPYNFVLYDNFCKEQLQNVSVNLRKLKGKDGWIDILFEEISDSQDQQYCFSIYPVEEEPQRAITLQLGKENIYQEGELLIDNEVSNKDIVFRIIHRWR